MSRRSRIIGFGSAALLVVVGAVCTVVLSGLASDLALGVMGLGVVLAASLVFLEVGFSEDRERAREQAAREEAARRREEAPGQAARQREEAGGGREQAQSGQRPTRPARARLARVRGRPRRLR